MPYSDAEGCIPSDRFAAPHLPCQWLISLDYDGTLRSESGAPISRDFFEQMAAWRQAGVRWGINTGRALPYLLQDLLPSSPVLPDFICTCERYVYLSDRDGRLQPATRHNAECMAINLALQAALEQPLHTALRQLRHTHPQLQWEIAHNDPLSIEAADSATMDSLMPLLRPLLCPGATIQRAGRYLRFSDARFSKGTALAYVMQQWQIKQENLFIMGDGHNDLDAFLMFPQAYCAAPANAHPEVIAWMQQNNVGIVSDSAGVLPALRKWFRERVEPYHRPPSARLGC